MSRRKPKCYYNDNLCEGEILPVTGFKKYLCEKCKKEDDSTPDEFPLDYDHNFNQ